MSEARECNSNQLWLPLANFAPYALLSARFGEWVRRTRIKIDRSDQRVELMDIFYHVSTWIYRLF